jgi:hypothetical protein
MNTVGNVLSQRPHIFSVITLQMNLHENILTYSVMMTGIKRLGKFWTRHLVVPKFEGFAVDNNILMRYNNHIYVPPYDELISLILNEVHRVVYMAHPGVAKMRPDLSPSFIW